MRPLLAGAALAAAFLLRELDVPPFPNWFYVFAWYPTLVLLDALVVRLGGESLLRRPRELGTMLWWSAVVWLGFEAINFRTQNWYYVFVPANPVERWAGITISFATVVPAILLPERVLSRLGTWRDLRGRPLHITARRLRLATGLGVLLLALVLAWPRYFYPLAWGAVWLLAEPALYRLDPARSLFGDLARGDWGRIARLMAGGLFAGLLWELYNAGDRGKWIYTVPFLEDLKLFEMPPLGFLGFAPFALQVWTLWHLAARARPAALAVSAAFAAVVLLGMERWTITSTVPRVAELPGVRTATTARLRAAGLTEVFRLATTSPGETAARAGLTGAEAARVREAARLSVLRGIGTRHGAALMAAGVRSVEELAAADPESLWRAVSGGRAARPTAAEVRVWVRAARDPYSLSR